MTGDLAARDAITIARAGAPVTGSESEQTTLAAAQAGDEAAFSSLVESYRNGLHVHCYRMLGNVHDADDALQETLVRAWRGLHRFEPRAPLRSWLYRIATNVCLTALAGRAAEARRRPSVSEMYGHIGVYPGDVPAETRTSPDVVYECNERVELAFIAAVQLLPARQRAVLLLRDVLDFSASDVAGLLDATVAAVNSSLQRARAGLDRGRGSEQLARRHAPGSPRVERDLVRRFTHAWRAGDVKALVQLLVADAMLTMPPNRFRVVGRGEVAEFLVSTTAGGRFERLRLLESRANGQPAIAAYLHDPETNQANPYAILVASIEGEAITSICRFDPHQLLPRLGLPAMLADVR
jgi:RNA polymerase sigma-70 factor, ECF subfamily